MFGVFDFLLFFFFLLLRRQRGLASLFIVTSQPACRERGWMIGVLYFIFLFFLLLSLSTQKFQAEGENMPESGKIAF